MEKKLAQKFKYIAIMIFLEIFDFTLNLFFQWEWSLEVKKDWEDGK